MRLGVLDIGSNTVHLLVMDAHHGARPWAAYSHKTELRLVEHLRSDGKLGSAWGGRKLVRDVGSGAQRIAEDTGAEEMLAFATSAIRDATNVDAVLEEVLRQTCVELAVLTGDDEARLTFLAARRWCGWSAGRLLVLDIGGGSLEMAVGVDEEPETAVSLPLGAARLTRSAMPGDPPDLETVEAVRRRVAAATWPRSFPNCWPPGRSTGSWRRRRPSSSWPGSREPPPAPRAATFGGSCRGSTWGYQAAQVSRSG